MCQRSTPVEDYLVAGRTVFVKRDDLYAMPPAPPVAKLRGLELLLGRLDSEGQNLVGCFEARVSSIGHGVAAVCKSHPHLSCIVAYPETRGHGLTPSLTWARELGAELLPIPSNYLNVCYALARRVVERRGGHMIPFGFECAEAIAAVALEARTVPPECLIGGTLVLCCGSGVTLAGLLRGLQILPARIVGVSSGRSIRQIRSCVSRHSGGLPSQLELHDAVQLYSQAAEAECPFPANRYYDLKAWIHLEEHLGTYSDPVLFWNVGA